MKRGLLLVALMIAGCGGVTSNGGAESDNSLIRPPSLGPCDASSFPVGPQFQVGDSSSDPWGSHTGTVVVYGDTDGALEIIGVDSTNHVIVWYMTQGSWSDVDRFESYPQSTRWCHGGSSSPGSGGSPGQSTDPEFLGICVANSVWSDATQAYLYGPEGMGNKLYCDQYGAGGCVPQSCSALGYRCGSHVDNCGRTIWCGACPVFCLCGGTYPHCKVCPLPQ